MHPQKFLDLFSTRNAIGPGPTGNRSLEFQVEVRKFVIYSPGGRKS